VSTPIYNELYEEIACEENFDNQWDAVVGYVIKEQQSFDCLRQSAINCVNREIENGRLQSN
jgi:hypothetical protein